MLYNLSGPQVEPNSSYWTEKPYDPPQVIRLEELTRFTDDPDHPWFFPAWDATPAVVTAEINALKALAASRSAPLPQSYVSEFLQIRPVPLGAVTIQQGSGKVIRTGAQLARWFEAETPGLSHRHALNLLLPSSGFSPARQARVWAALDATIYSAVLAAWHYKWYTSRADVRFRPRPNEVDGTLNVLFDTAPSPAEFRVAGDVTPGDNVLDLPTVASGVPRHPAYPSGHSTIGAAASRLIAWFFPAHAVEIEKLGDNVGRARLWAGVHYESDHTAGATLGRAVAELMIRQLQRDGAGDAVTYLTPPSNDTLQTHR